ncbi:MAG: hypothetical protein VX346_21930 [Planctomycetota bacterium]|nr:hypothetical protein [Planctomycetota bacterium]
MKHLLGFLLVMGVVGCDPNPRGEHAATATIAEARQGVGSAAAQKDTPTPFPETASNSVPETVSLDANESVAAPASPGIPKSDIPIKESSQVEVTVVAPGAGLTLREVHQGDVSLLVHLKNKGNNTVTLWPYLSVKITNPRGKAVPRSMNLGRFGFRSTPSILEGIPFVSLKPGEVHEIEVNLKQYRFDPQVITGWRFRRPGKYDVALVYEYDRALVVMDYGKGCRNLDRPDAPWNLAVETRESRRVVLSITN